MTANSNINFILCCPRSGSTWLRFMLNSHPEISCGPEFSIFSQEFGLVNMIQTYRNINSHTGLRNALNERDFLKITKDFIFNIYTTSKNTHKPSANILVDKSTDNSFFVKEIRYVFTNAKFIILVRDPRDVAISMVECAKTWGNAFFPKEIYEAFDLWVLHNSSIINEKYTNKSALLVRYEELLVNPYNNLKRLFAFLGVKNLSENQINRIVKENEFQKMKKLNWHNGNFFRQGKFGEWKKILTDKEIIYYENNVKDLHKKMLALNL